MDNFLRKEPCLLKYKAYNLGNFSTFAAILKILHPQCIAIPVRTLPGFIIDLSLGQVPLLRNYRPVLIMQITFPPEQIKGHFKKNHILATFPQNATIKL